MRKHSNARRVSVTCAITLTAFASLPVVQAGPILGESGFNFRETRINQPLRFTQDPDVIVLGLDIFDTATGVAPAGAIVNAINRGTGTVLSLSPSGTSQFSTATPYSPQLANGQWEVVVQSNAGNAAGFLLPAFGTGAGTGPVPGVQNLAVTPGAQPALDWTLPNNLPSANNGNIDRLRIRIQDSNGDTLLDQRLPSPGSLSDTSFTAPPGLIDHDGLFHGQVFVEGLNPFVRSRTFEPFIVTGVGTGGDPADVTGTFNFRDFRGANSVMFGAGDLLTVGVNVDPSDTTGTFAYGRIGSSLLALTQAGDFPTEFASSLNYDAALTGPWNLTLNNGEHTTNVQTNGVGNAGLLPLVRNVALTADNLTPTLSWDLPAGNQEPFTSIDIGLFDDVTDARIPLGPAGGLFATLGPTATSFTFPDGILQFGGNYVARVILRNAPAGAATTNRSLSFINFTPLSGSNPNPVFLPTVDANGVFNFDIDVDALIPIVLDPFVAVGYDYAIGQGNPNFRSVSVPQVGSDDEFLLSFLDGQNLIETLLMAGVEFIFPVAGGVDAFTVSGIDPAVGLDPTDVTAFATTLTFVASGQFTGTMTPIQVFVDGTVPEPATLALLALGLVAMSYRKRRRA